MRIERRDRQIIGDVFLSRVLRRDDLIRLGYFTSIPRCNSRLLALKQEGLLKARSLVSGVALRAPIYQCSARGVRIAADELGIPAAEAIEIHRAGASDTVLRHALRCSEIRIRLVQDLREPGPVQFLDWSHELLCHHEFVTASGRSVTVKPDGLVVVAAHGKEKHIFVEADLGNAALPKFQQSVARYQQYLSSGAFCEAYGPSTFTVLVVTTDERRLAHMRQLGQVPWLAFTTWKRLAADSLAGDIYSVVTSARANLVEVLG